VPAAAEPPPPEPTEPLPPELAPQPTEALPPEPLPPEPAQPSLPGPPQAAVPELAQPLRPEVLEEQPSEGGEEALAHEPFAVAAEGEMHAEPLPGEPVEHDPQPELPAPSAAPATRLPAFGAPGGPPHARRRRRGRHAGPARVAALIALLAAIAVVVLVVRALVHTGPATKVLAPKVIKLLIPEGKTRAQIAEIAKTAGLVGSYRVASRHSPLLNPVHYGASSKTPDLEGFLFPATYDINPGQPASRLVQEQLIAFRENFGSGEINGARSLHVTPYQLLTVASMIEREAQVPGDRAKIAAVIYNRLKQGMPLGIDAAIYYAVEQRKGIATYTKELTEADLHIDSPYNTRTHTGLPPTPISNPGLASIEAAAHPAHVPYLYYVAAADGCGEQVFSTTQAAFEANAAAYAAAVQSNGGHPPTCKHK
jgi:cell division protein YceG involved in septum cleavage